MISTILSIKWIDGENMEDVDAVERLKKIAKYTETSPGCFAICEKDLGKVENDINDLMKEGIIKDYFDDQEEAEKNIEEYETHWFILTDKGIEKLKKIRDDGGMKEKDYYYIVETLGW